MVDPQEVEVDIELTQKVATQKEELNAKNIQIIDL